MGAHSRKIQWGGILVQAVVGVAGGEVGQRGLRAGESLPHGEAAFAAALDDISKRGQVGIVSEGSANSSRNGRLRFGEQVVGGAAIVPLPGASGIQGPVAVDEKLVAVLTPGNLEGGGVAAVPVAVGERMGVRVPLIEGAGHGDAFSRRCPQREGDRGGACLGLFHAVKSVGENASASSRKRARTRG